ncbi:MAG: hypothetical protein DRR19_12120 [Candidatus Parabeggiatoa sp. nov. 1]|nr:MAG: hypothetical protein DRR19_12120 [Gammaproteobacteria bacterium]
MPYQPDVVKEVRANLPAAKVVYGHVHFGIHKFLRLQNYQYIAFLRHPIDRVLSFYSHNARHPDTSHHAAIQGGMSLLEMLESEITIETNNHITRLLTAQGQPDLFDDTQMLEQALANIEKHFCFVGLVEKFAESVALLGKTLGWQSSYEIPYINVDPTKHLHQIDAQTQAALEKYNRLDLLLYEQVSRGFSL